MCVNQTLVLNVHIYSTIKWQECQHFVSKISEIFRQIFTPLSGNFAEKSRFDDTGSGERPRPVPAPHRPADGLHRLLRRSPDRPAGPVRRRSRRARFASRGSAPHQARVRPRGGHPCLPLARYSPMRIAVSAAASRASALSSLLLRSSALALFLACMIGPISSSGRQRHSA